MCHRHPPAGLWAGRAVRAVRQRFANTSPTFPCRVLGVQPRRRKEPAKTSLGRATPAPIVRGGRTAARVRRCRFLGRSAGPPLSLPRLAPPGGSVSRGPALRRATGTEATRRGGVAGPASRRPTPRRHQALRCRSRATPTVPIS